MPSFMIAFSKCIFCFMEASEVIKSFFFSCLIYGGIFLYFCIKEGINCILGKCMFILC